MPAKREREIEPGIWEYSDGSKRYYGHDSKPNGALAERPAAAVEASKMMQADPSALARKRWDAYTEVSRKTVGPDRWARIVDRRAELAETDDGHVGNQAMQVVGQAIGAQGFRRQQADQASGASVTLALSGEAVRELRGFVGDMASRLLERQTAGELPAADVVEVDVSD